MSSISDLPCELIEEILSRVPIHSRRAVRSTCKRWNTLSKDQSFIEKHCGKAAKEFLLNMTREYEHDQSDISISPMRFNLRNTNELPSSIEKIGTMLTPIKIYNVYQCDGLFLLVTMDHSVLVVWNPYLGHTRRIEVSKPKTSYLDYHMYAIGYDNKKNHKVLKVYNESYNVVKHEIYDFNSDSWRVLEITSPRSYYGGASLKGNTYFVARINGKNFVICFDFTTERFGPCLHLPVDFEGEDVTLSCVREEQLAVFVHRRSVATYEMEIQITTKIEPNAVSWSKFLKVDIQIGPSSFFLSHFVVYSFFIDKEKKVAVVCGRDCPIFFLETSIIVGEDGYFEKTDLGNVFSYIPSSVLIQGRVL